MRGRHEIVVQNSRLQYKFVVERNITVLRGDSATGKTTLIDMIAAHQRTGEQSGVRVHSDRPCAVLTGLNWEINLAALHDSIVFIDEGETFVRTKEFARAVEDSDNYYVIATRSSLPNLPYSTKEIYGIKNKSGNRYQGTRRLYAEFFPLCDTASALGTPDRPDLVVVEDTNAGFAFFADYFGRYGIRCISAGGKSKVFRTLCEQEYANALVIADGAAFGPEIEQVLSLRNVHSIAVYLPESFEWVILRADLLKDAEIREILENPAPHIAGEEYFSWERYFTDLLTRRSRGTYLEYNKRKLNENYLQSAEQAAIGRVLPEMGLQRE